MIGGGGLGGTSSMVEGIRTSELSLAMVGIGRRKRTTEEKKREPGASSRG